MRGSTLAAGLAMTFATMAQQARAEEAKGCRPAARFGDAGRPTFEIYSPPAYAPGWRAKEPSIGIPYNTDDVFMMNEFYTLRAHFEDMGLDDDNTTIWEAQWKDVSPLYDAPTSVDPMLHADPELGRVWTGHLLPGCSYMQFSDDNGETWLPCGNMCTGAQFDHQTIGSGPFFGSGSIVPDSVPGIYDTPYYHAIYYCAQIPTTACVTSPDGGVTWAEFTQVLGGCGGLHGHVRVSRRNGFAALPFKVCSENPIGASNLFGNVPGFGFTVDNGLTWDSKFVAPDTAFTAAGGYWDDPSVQFGAPLGFMWFGYANPDGAFIALSKDDGETYELLGGGMPGVSPTQYLNVAQFHDPPIVATEGADVSVGDDDRVAYFFTGLVDLDGDCTRAEYPDPNQCTDRQEEMEWQYFTAFTYDAGETWTVVQITAPTDPMQRGGIGAGDCRNLLDFNDSDIDSKGRVYVGYADGCTNDCETNEPGQREGAFGYRDYQARLARQETGLGLYAEFDNDPTPGEVDEDRVRERLGAKIARAAGTRCPLVRGDSCADVFSSRQMTRENGYLAQPNSCSQRCSLEAHDTSAQAPTGCRCDGACAESMEGCCTDYNLQCMAPAGRGYSNQHDALLLDMSLTSAAGAVTARQLRTMAMQATGAKFEHTRLYAHKTVGSASGGHVQVSAKVAVWPENTEQAAERLISERAAFPPVEDEEEELETYAEEEHEAGSWEGVVTESLRVLRFRAGKVVASADLTESVKEFSAAQANQADEEANEAASAHSISAASIGLAAGGAAVGIAALVGAAAVVSRRRRAAAKEDLARVETEQI